MAEMLSLDRKDREEPQNVVSRLTEEFLLDVRTEGIPMERAIRMPVANLSLLGEGVASLSKLIEALPKNTESKETLYRVVNANKGDVLKVAKDGNFYGLIKPESGMSRFAKFEEVKAAASVEPSFLASEANIAMLMMAIALYSIERELKEIQEMEKQVIRFLEIEKESEVEADVVTLNDILTKYKHNWDNEQYVTSNHKMVCDIQRTARKNIISFQKNTSEIVKLKKLIVGRGKVNQTLKDLLKKFKYYRLALYTFSLASMTEIMLSGNFKEENISIPLKEIRGYTDEYRELFEECSVFLEKMSRGSVETNVLRGVGTASDAVGKIIGSIPKIKDGQVDEFLQDTGEKIKGNAEGLSKDVVSSFAKVSDPQTRIFTEKMDEMIQIYNHTEEICFDRDNIFLIAKDNEKNWG